MVVVVESSWDHNDDDDGCGGVCGCYLMAKMIVAMITHSWGGSYS